MKTVDKVSITELLEMAKNMYGNLVKADVDVSKKIMIVDMGMHSDGEAYFLESGSKQNDLWGINLHPDDYGTDDFIEFDSMINIRPRQGNPSKDVLDLDTKQEIVAIVHGIVYD